MVLYTIEVACAGNLARSPMAEALGNARASEYGLADLVQVVSSGVRVSTPLTYARAVRFIRIASELPAEHCSPVPPKGLELQQEVLSDTGIGAARYGRDADYRNDVNALTRTRRGDLCRLGRTLRDEVLREVGFRAGADRKQMVARPDVSLVLGLDSGVADEASIIYAVGGRSRVPVTTLGEYTRLQPDIEDPIGSTDVQRYRDLRDFLAGAMGFAIQKFVREHR